MADAVFGSAREVWALILAAVTDTGPYLIALCLLVAAGAAVFFRGKLGALIWLPALAAAGFVAWRRFGH
jgi:hypothetical protein